MSFDLVSRAVGDFLFVFGALFAVINPYGLAFVFLDRTMNQSKEERALIAGRVALFSFMVIFVSLFFGAYILKFFGISMSALRIGGGLVVAASGWTMLHSTPTSSVSHATSNLKFEAAKSLAFFPLTIPLTTGPGTIATAIAIGTSRHDSLESLVSAFPVWITAALLVTATIYHAYSRSGVLARVVGEQGTSIITRLSAFLLLCVGVQIVLTGVVDTVRLLPNGAPLP